MERKGVYGGRRRRVGRRRRRVLRGSGGRGGRLRGRGWGLCYRVGLVPGRVGSDRVVGDS